MNSLNLQTSRSITRLKKCLLLIQEKCKKVRLSWRFICTMTAEKFKMKCKCNTIKLGYMYRTGVNVQFINNDKSCT